MTSKAASKKSAAQAPFARKAASKLAEAKKPALSAKLAAINHAHSVKVGLAADSAPDQHDRKHSHAARAPPSSGIRLLSKREVCAITNATFPSVWAWMRMGVFPRSRIVNGRSMWLSTEIETWIAELPLRPLKGDQPAEQKQEEFA